MARKILIKDSLNQVDINEDIAAIFGERTPTVLAWYKIAKTNLHSAKIMLENGNIPHTIFFIQQCIECFVKGSFLEAEVLTPQNIRCISHNPSEAYRALYTKIDYQYGLYLCDEIPRQLNKASSFADRLKINAAIANQFTRAYWKEFEKAPTEYLNYHYDNPIPLGLTQNTPQLICHYQFLASMYAENMLLLLSCVFTDDVQNETRYPALTDSKVITPTEKFDNNIVREGLPTIIPLLEKISNTIIGDSKL